jgi:glycosyltransferase involved in cell wall biosynthesis
MERRMQLLIATLLPADGHACGVQTHFKAIAEQARLQEMPVQVLSPYAANPWSRRVTNVVRRIAHAVDVETSVIWQNAALAYHLTGRLQEALRARHSEPVTVYAQDTLSAAVALRLRSSRRAFRVVLVIHYNESEAKQFADNGQTRPGGPLWRLSMALEGRVLPKVDKLIFVSEFMRKTLEARLPAIRKSDIAVIPNFPKPASTRPVAPGTAGDLIAIGTLEPRKNHAFLLRALAEANAAGKRYRLTLVGDGPSRPDLEELATKLGVREQVTFAGYAPDASDLIPGHRAFVHAARAENFPIVFLEAMQHGVPPLSGAVGGIPEIFDDGVEGRFWPLDDPRRASAILIEALESESRHAAMSAAARRRYQRDFSPDVLGPRWLEAICGPHATFTAPPGDSRAMNACR